MSDFMPVNSLPQMKWRLSISLDGLADFGQTAFEVMARLRNLNEDALQNTKRGPCLAFV